MATRLELADRLDKDGELEIAYASSMHDDAMIWLGLPDFLGIAARFGFAVVKLPQR